MSEAKTGDKVQVHYTGKLKDNTIFDTSQDREPLEFVIGSGQLIPGFEQGVVGMSENESRVITIPAEDAYGPHRDEMVIAVPREELPDGLNPQPGQHVDIRLQNGQTRTAAVTEASEKAITLDINHPLAGKDLVFDVLLVSIAS
jgi:FKBP-type peptidyl-prolyl cis-trans isomerase 2